VNPYSDRFMSLIKRTSLRRGAVFGAILLLALFAFEIFNYSTTDFALTDMLGANLRFLGIRWATILSIAFCGIDFAGIARLFTPEQGRNEPVEAWYLFGAWLLAAAMNAALTWWGVAVAVRNHQELSTLIIGQAALTKAVPVFVAMMVWLIRVLIIGTFSMAGDRLFSVADNRPARWENSNRPQPFAQPQQQPATLSRPERPSPVPFHPAPKPEPTYQPVGMSASPHNVNVGVRK
jgi:hypothetical protein